MRTGFSTRAATFAARTHVYAGARPHPAATAIYTLSDPRDTRCPRYVGQTRDPRRRFAQHVNMARLDLWDCADMDVRGSATQALAGMLAVGQRKAQRAVAEALWWVRSPQHRPLYAWIRELHRDGGRLPFMWVEAWVEPAADALVAERAAILRLLARGAALLNVEARQLGAQLPLL